MASLRIVPHAVNSAVADAAHAEMTRFIARSPDVVKKQLDKVLGLNTFLTASVLPQTCALNAGKRLAAEFLESNQAKLERSFLLLYCARETKKINTGMGKMTIFLALGKLSLDNGLPQFGDEPSSQVASGDAILVPNELPQTLDKNEGGGFALVSDWTTS